MHSFKLLLDPKKNELISEKAFSRPQAGADSLIMKCNKLKTHLKRNLGGSYQSGGAETLPDFRCLLKRDWHGVL